jgi:hypothetical protein
MSAVGINRRASREAGKGEEEEEKLEGITRWIVRNGIARYVWLTALSL